MLPGQHVNLVLPSGPCFCRHRLELRMYARRTLYKAHLLTCLRIDTTCRRLLDASASRARSPMLAHDLPTSARAVGSQQRQANWHFGRAAYCTSGHLTGRSLKCLTEPKLSRWSTAAQTRHAHRSHVRAATSVVEDRTAGATSQHTLPKFARRTSVKDVKEHMLTWLSGCIMLSTLIDDMCCNVQGKQDKGVSNIGSTYDIRGWVRTARNQKTFSFIEVCLPQMLQLFF